MQSLEYFWSLQQVSFGNLCAAHWPSLLRTLEARSSAIAHKQGQVDPSSASGGMESQRCLQCLVASALAAQVLTLAPPENTALAAELFLRQCQTLMRCSQHMFGTTLSAHFHWAHEAAEAATAGGSLYVMQLLVAYLAHECPGTIGWLQVHSTPSMQYCAQVMHSAAFARVTWICTVA